MICAFQCHMQRSFLLDLNSEVYLEPSQTSTVELFCENSRQLKAVNYFRKKLHRTCSTGSSIRPLNSYHDHHIPHIHNKIDVISEKETFHHNQDILMQYSCFLCIAIISANAE